MSPRQRKCATCINFEPGAFLLAPANDCAVYFKAQDRHGSAKVLSWLDHPERHNSCAFFRRDIYGLTKGEIDGNG